MTKQEQVEASARGMFEMWEAEWLTQWNAANPGKQQDRSLGWDEAPDAIRQAWLHLVQSVAPQVIGEKVIRVSNDKAPGVQGFIFYDDVDEVEHDDENGFLPDLVLTDQQVRNLTFEMLRGQEARPTSPLDGLASLAGMPGVRIVSGAELQGLFGRTTPPEDSELPIDTDGTWGDLPGKEG